MNTPYSGGARNALLAGNRGVRRGEPHAGDADWCPAMDAAETAEGYRFTFDVPGLTRQDLEVRVDGQMLSLSGARTTRQRAERALCVERPSGAFVWRIALPPETQVERTSATLRDGVLELHVPKPPSAHLLRSNGINTRPRHEDGGNDESA